MDDLGLQIFTLKVLLNPSKALLYPPESQKLPSDQTGGEDGFVWRNVITYQLALPLNSVF